MAFSRTLFQCALKCCVCHNMCAREHSRATVHVQVIIFSIVRRGSNKPFFRVSPMTRINFSVAAHSLVVRCWYIFFFYLHWVYMHFLLLCAIHWMLFDLPGFSIFKLWHFFSFCILFMLWLHRNTIIQCLSAYHIHCAIWLCVYVMYKTFVYI